VFKWHTHCRKNRLDALHQLWILHT
jgi:hypothetical protein